MDALVSTELSTDTGSENLYVALELSRATWLVALHSPITNKVSQHRLDGGDVEGLLGLITRKREQAAARLGRSVRVACCFEAGYDGFWLHRWLCTRGIEGSRRGQPAGRPPGSASQNGSAGCGRASAHVFPIGSPGKRGDVRSRAGARGRKSRP